VNQTSERMKENLNEAAGRKDDQAYFGSLAYEMLQFHSKDRTFMRLLLFSALEGHDLSEIFFHSTAREMKNHIRRYIKQRITDGARADRKVEPPAAIEVQTAAVIERRTNRSVEVVGSLIAEDEVTISSQASGNLADITVDLGTAVRSGQVIARIDQRELKFKVDQAEGTLHQAEARLGIKRGERIDPQKQPDVRLAFAALERARYDLNASRSLAE